MLCGMGLTKGVEQRVLTAGVDQRVLTTLQSVSAVLPDNGAAAGKTPKTPPKTPPRHESCDGCVHGDTLQPYNITPVEA